MRQEYFQFPFQFHLLNAFKSGLVECVSVAVCVCCEYIYVYMYVVYVCLCVSLCGLLSIIMLLI